MKLAIIGTGLIVGEALKALTKVPQIELSAIYARPQSLEKGKKLAAEYGIKEVYSDYDRLLSESDSDFIYVANINSVHFSYAEKALQAGKNLIIEKPICVNNRQFQTLKNIALDKKLYLFEAVTFLHAPFFDEIRKMVQSIGKIRSIQCNYSKYSSRYDRYLKGDVAPVFNPECSGGALLDLNIYSINFVVSLFGFPTGDIKYYYNKGYNGIDISGTLIMKYDDFTATCTAAKDSYSPCFDIIQGEEGYIMINGSPDNLSEIEFSCIDKSGKFSVKSPFHRMVDEFTDFEDIFRKGNYEKCLEYLQISENAMKVVSATLGE